jgi:HK97 gp10 family phage protein
MKVEVTDNSKEVLEALQEAAVKALETCGLTAESYAKQLCPVDTGNLRNSITHEVDDSELACYVGTNVEYAAYVECGTGHYATTGGGTTKDSWVYQDDFGNWHRAYPQKPQPYLKPAVADHADTYRGIIEEAMTSG